MSSATVSKTRLPSPPPGAARFARLMLVFGVTIPVSLAPLLGELHIPGLTTILDVFPLNLREGLIAFGALTASIPAIAVQAYYHASRPESFRRWVLAVVLTLFIMILIVYAVYTMVVIQVPYLGGDRYARFVIGDEMKPTCVCVRQGKEITECVGRILSFNVTVVEGCFPRREVQRNKLLLALPYLGLLALFGAGVGLVTLTDKRR